MLAALAGAAAGAGTSAGLYLTGAGFGHGVGMSQYGAAGYAQHGYNYRQILQAYYAQTTLGSVTPRRRVTVLLKPSGGAGFTGATVIKGSSIALSATATYSVQVAGAQLRLLSAGQTVGVFTAPLTVTGPGPLTLAGRGAYRGALVFTPSAKGGVMTVNSVGLDNYVRGVVAAEMPSNWPLQALEAQAVAARTYAISAGAVAAGFSLYSDTRSQMYGGVAAETPATDAAVAATAGQIVEYDGTPATTYFFASSGGETESVQNVWTGVTPEAWLVSQHDPYDDSFNNPYYRWSAQFGLKTAAAKLHKLVDGSLEGIEVLSRGVSPRIVEAQIVGTRGRTDVTGAELQAALGTPSTWMSLTTITATGTRTTSAASPTQTAPVTTTTVTGPSTTSSVTGVTQTTATSTDTTTTATQTATTPTSTTGGNGLSEDAERASVAAVKPSYMVHGTIFPARAGARVTVQRRHDGWETVARAQERPSGVYSVAVRSPGTYRVLYGTVVGPEVTIR
jgi:stage II sporulation protein D